MVNECKWAKPFKHPFTHPKDQLYICTILESVGISSHYCFCTEKTYEECSEAKKRKRMSKEIILSRNYRDWIWREIQDTLEAEKNKEIHNVIFGENGDLFEETPGSSFNKLHAIYNIILRYEEVYHEWNLRLHGGKTAEEERVEEQDAYNQKKKKLLSQDVDAFKREIVTWYLN